MPVYTITFEAEELTGINVDTATHRVVRGHKQGHIRCRNNDDKDRGRHSSPPCSARTQTGTHPLQEQ